MLLKQKTNRIILAGLIIMCLVLSIKPFLFFCDIMALVFSPNHSDTTMTALVRNLHRNSRFEPVTQPYLKNDVFLSFLARDLIRKNSQTAPMEHSVFLPNIINIFPENLFIEHFELYPLSYSEKPWENFDRLFFLVIQDKKLNPLSFEVLVNAFKNKRIGIDAFINVTEFLSWNKHFSLVEDLLVWGRDSGMIGPSQYQVLQKRMEARQKTPPRFRRTDISLPSQIINKINTLEIGDGDKIRLGDNLIEDGSFEDANTLANHWIFSNMSDTAIFSAGSFIGDIDAIDTNTMRIMGFFAGRDPGKENPRGGFLYKTDIPLKGRVFILYFRYQTQGVTESPSFWLGQKKETGLQNTASQWKEIAYLFDNRKTRWDYIRPLFRIWGTGSVWFDDLYLAEIEIPGYVIENEKLFTQ